MKKVLANNLRMGSHSSESPATCADGLALPWMLVVLDREGTSSSRMTDLDWDVEEFASAVQVISILMLRVHVSNSAEMQTPIHLTLWLDYKATILFC